MLTCSPNTDDGIFHILSSVLIFYILREFKLHQQKNVNLIDVSKTADVNYLEMCALGDSESKRLDIFRYLMLS